MVYAAYSLYPIQHSIGNFNEGACKQEGKFIIASQLIIVRITTDLAVSNAGVFHRSIPYFIPLHVPRFTTYHCIITLQSNDAAV